MILLGDSVEHVCHICNTKITDEIRFALISTKGIFALCDYCKDEQVVIAERDEDAQEQGLQWAKELLERI